jgi:hypothetical protein
MMKSSIWLTFSLLRLYSGMNGFKGWIQVDDFLVAPLALGEDVIVIEQFLNGGVFGVQNGLDV